MTDEPKKKRPPTSGTRRGNGAGTGGPANGKGWGGPAKGAHDGAGPSAEPLQPGDSRQGARADNDDPAEQAHRAEQRATKRDLRERMRAVLEEIAEDAKQPATARVAAADKLLDRLEGKPVQTTINANVDDVARLSDDELRAELARLSGEAAEAAAGGGAPDVPG